VIQGIHAAVTRCRADGTPGGAGWIPEEKLTVEEAVWAWQVARLMGVAGPLDWAALSRVEER